MYSYSLEGGNTDWLISHGAGLRNGLMERTFPRIENRATHSRQTSFDLFPVGLPFWGKAERRCEIEVEHFNSDPQLKLSGENTTSVASERFFLVSAVLNGTWLDEPHHGMRLSDPLIYRADARLCIGV